MEAKAILKRANTSAQKARLVADQIRGMPVEKAEQLAEEIRAELPEITRANDV